MAAWTETTSPDDILQLEPVVQPHQVRYQVRLRVERAGGKSGGVDVMQTNKTKLRGRERILHHTKLIDGEPPAGADLA